MFKVQTEKSRSDIVIQINRGSITKVGLKLQDLKKCRLSNHCSRVVDRRQSLATFFPHVTGYE